MLECKLPFLRAKSISLIILGMAIVVLKTWGSIDYMFEQEFGPVVRYFREKKYFSEDKMHPFIPLILEKVGVSLVVTGVVAVSSGSWETGVYTSVFTMGLVWVLKSLGFQKEKESEV